MKQKDLRYRLSWFLLTAAIVTGGLLLPPFIAKSREGQWLNQVVIAQKAPVRDPLTGKLRLLLWRVTNRARAGKTTQAPPGDGMLSPAEAVKAGDTALLALAKAGVLPEGAAVEPPVFGEPEAVAGRSQYYVLSDVGTGEAYGFYLLLYEMPGGARGELILDAASGALLQLEHFSKGPSHAAAPEEMAAAFCAGLSLSPPARADLAAGLTFHTFQAQSPEGLSYTLLVGVSARPDGPGGLSLWCYPEGMEAPYQDHYEGG